MNSSKPTPEGVLKIIRKIRQSNRQSHDHLFDNYPKELSQIFKGVSSDDVRSVVDFFWIIRLMLERSEFDEDFNKYLS